MYVCILKMDNLLDVIRGICDNKVKNGIVPSYALYTDIANIVGSNGLKEELNRLVSEKKLRFGRTINTLYFEII